MDRLAFSALNQTPDERIGGEIAAARTIFERFGNSLRAQARLRRGLAAYDRAITETQSLMQRSGVSAACTVCGAQTGGSCCFEGIEAGYDRVLLLVNLLLECPLPDHREVPGSCLFVGEHGCRLRARYYYCVHYLCPALETTLEPPLKEALRSTVGSELASGWEVEGVIRACLRQADERKVTSIR